MKFKHNNRCFYYLFYSELRHNQYQCVDNKHLIYQHTFTFVSRAKLKGKFLLNTCMLLGHASIYIMDNGILTACK